MPNGAVLLVIPARMSATRLPGKPLADIAGLPMIVQVKRRAEEAGIGRVLVATDDDRIAAAVRADGGEAVMTRSDHENGSSRIHEAVGLVDPERRFGVILNVQGDLPTVEPATIRAGLAPLADAAIDIGTVVAEIAREEERHDPNVVKVAAFVPKGGTARALYFSRATVPANDGPHYHHIGLYAYRRDALDRYVALPPSALERREKLEQLRALEAGMTIGVALVDAVPLGVDTPADLERARQLLGPRTSGKS
jgi:3-deoxy-manno-octulosonate cytidylyltransferase (CMP-KDO synthetase)